jgi:hypothetical protein
MYHCSLCHPSPPCIDTLFRLRVGVVLLHPQGSHILRRDEQRIRGTTRDTYVASGSRYLPSQADSYTGHYTDHILRIGHM